TVISAPFEELGLVDVAEATGQVVDDVLVDTDTLGLLVDRRSHADPLPLGKTVQIERYVRVHVEPLLRVERLRVAVGQVRGQRRQLKRRHLLSGHQSRANPEPRLPRAPTDET